MAYQSQDIIRRSATNGFTPAPQARDHQQEVAKLIDVTTCIGCKACQVACSEWNDLRDEVGHNVGVYDNPRGSDRQIMDGDAFLGSRAERQTGVADS
ncbi:UNVERIFIED_ORG: ferredoxin [Atlantibacter sp. SORGH_AS 304]|nr:ferredoxin [Atlantibacter sp. SORGH_AS_0304]